MSTIFNCPNSGHQYSSRSRSLHLPACAAPINCEDELLADLWDFCKTDNATTSPLTPRMEMVYWNTSPQFVLPESIRAIGLLSPLELTQMNLSNYETHSTQEVAKRLSTTSLTSCITSNSEDSFSSTTSASSIGSTENNSPLYKTELCASFLKNGECPYDSKCQFAHGIEELRGVKRLPKYRSKPCSNWLRSGTCRYGQRCCFKH